MELFGPEFLSALAAIVLIDLVLAGDNAIVIALAARNLPAALQRRAVIWGCLGAVAVRACMTLVVVSLLRVPGLMLAGGALLVWIAWKLVAPSNKRRHADVAPATTFWGAMKTIVVADAVMGLDNVLAVAGAAHGSFVLVVFGLLISIPIIIGGSRLVLKCIERFPPVIYAGAGVLAWTAVKMITGEPVVREYLDGQVAITVVLYVVTILGVVGLGYVQNRRHVHAMRNA